MYRITIKRNYYTMNFAYEEISEATSFAWDALEHAEDDIEIKLSIAEEDDEDGEDD